MDKENIKKIAIEILNNTENKSAIYYNHITENYYLNYNTKAHMATIEQENCDNTFNTISIFKY